MTTRTHSPRTAVLSALYIGAVAALGAAVIGVSLRHAALTESGPRVLAWAVLAVLTMMAGEFSLGLPLRACRLSISDALVFLSVLLFGTDLATLTGALDGYAASARSHGRWPKRVFNTAGMAISVYAASRLFTMAAQRAGLWGDAASSAARLALPLLLLAAAQYAVNTALVAGVVSITEGVPQLAIWKGSLRWAGTGYLAGSVAAALVFLVVRHAGPVSLVAVVPFPILFYLITQEAIGRPQEVKVTQEG